MEAKYQETYAKWEQFVLQHQKTVLTEIVAEDATFHSPVVWSPQKGKALTEMYLQGAGIVLEQGFHYTRKVFSPSGDYWVLEFASMIGEVSVEGVDMVQLNDEGKIIDFKVMVRPLKGMQALQNAMAEMLTKLRG
jgi:hypothetical protein